MAKTTQELLDAVDDAIYEIVTNRVASVSIDGVAQTFHNVGELRQFRRELLATLRDGSRSVRLVDFRGG